MKKDIEAYNLKYQKPFLAKSYNYEWKSWEILKTQAGKD